HTQQSAEEIECQRTESSHSPPGFSDSHVDIVLITRGSDTFTGVIPVDGQTGGDFDQSSQQLGGGEITGMAVVSGDLNQAMMQPAYLSSEEAVHDQFLFFIDQILKDLLFANDPGVNLLQRSQASLIYKNPVSVVQEVITGCAADGKGGWQ